MEPYGVSHCFSQTYWVTKFLLTSYSPRIITDNKVSFWVQHTGSARFRFKVFRDLIYEKDASSRMAGAACTLPKWAKARDCKQRYAKGVWLVVAPKPGQVAAPVSENIESRRWWRQISSRHGARLGEVLIDMRPCWLGSCSPARLNGSSIWNLLFSFTNSTLGYPSHWNPLRSQRKHHGLRSSSHSNNVRAERPAR